MEKLEDSAPLKSPLVPKIKWLSRLLIISISLTPGELGMEKELEFVNSKFDSKRKFWFFWIIRFSNDIYTRTSDRPSKAAIKQPETLLKSFFIFFGLFISSNFFWFFRKFWTSRKLIFREKSLLFVMFSFEWISR